MNRLKLARQKLILTSAFALFLVSNTFYITHSPAQPPVRSLISAVRFVPPTVPPEGQRDAPKGRPRGGGTRGGDRLSLTALVPVTEETLAARIAGNQARLSNEKSVLALTVAEYPALWFYVPFALSGDRPITFVLQEYQGREHQGKEIYKTTFSVSQAQPGLVQFRLPANAAPLEIGKMYHWFFAISSDAEESVYVDGFIQRIAPPETLATQLQQSTPRDRAALYAANGIWHDALDTLAQLRTANPQDAKLTTDWENLFKAIGLNAIAKEPIVQCCTPN